MSDLIEETMYDISADFNEEDLTLNDLISRFELLCDELRAVLVAEVRTKLSVPSFME